MTSSACGKRRLTARFPLRLAAGYLLTTLLAACGPSGKTPPPTADLLAAARDTTTAPGDDFFQYANGTWLKQHPIPASESAWGIGKEVQNEVYAQLRAISEQAAAAKAAPGTAQQQIGDFWATGMDSATIDGQGVKPLQPELDRLAALQTPADVQLAVARLLPLGVNALIGLNIAQDPKNSEKMCVLLWQAGLGLPNRDYYFDGDARTAGIRREYAEHLTRTFALLGQDAATAQRHSAAVLTLETALAKVSRKLEDLRDPYANYHKLTVKQLNALTPGLDWAAWLTQLGVPRPDSVVVGQPEFYREAGRLLKTVPLDTWGAYLQWQLLHTYAPTLSEPFADEHFRFNGTVLQGSKQQRPRWKRVLDAEEAALGDALGKLFVQAYFRPAAKARYERMTKDVMSAFADHIRRLDWMSDSTKLKALAKLARITPKVGYPAPDKWKTYGTLRIARDSYAQNVQRANQWRYRYQLNLLGKPVDRTLWDITPQTYNAYYNPSNNEIVLPAAIFAIPGLPDSLADDAVVYGYGGASTIGHELTHGFDDEGSQFDEKGNLREWWTKTDRAAFQQRVNGIVRQFNAYTVLDDRHLNGKATAGENIADLGGLVIAFDAFKKTPQFKENKKIGGLTPTQRYFLGYALGWQSHQRDEMLAQRLLSDVHSPAAFRVNGPVADISAFYQAFGVQPHHRLYRPDSARVVIW